MARVKITARVYGPRLMARSKVFPAEVHRLLEDTLEDVSDQARNFFTTAAPVGETKRLRQGIDVQKTSAGVAIRISAVDPQTGFDYVGVTRFGHKVKRIRPIHGRSVSGRRQFRSGLLRFNIGGRTLFRRSVRGYRPKVDWVVSPRVETHTYARKQFKVFERELARRW